MMTSVASSQTYDDAGSLTHTAAIYDGSTAYTLVYDHHNRLTKVKDNAGSTRLARFTWDDLGRRIEYIDDTNSETKRYYFDGVNEVYEYNDSGDPLRYFVHGVSYIDERLAMVNCYATTGTSDDRPYYYVLDRMYNVRFIVDRAGAIIERYAYDPYGKPLIRESGGRGDTTDLGRVTAADNTRYGPSVAGTIWEPRCDMDDDGDVDSNDMTPYNYAVTVTWPANPTVSQAFSDVGNPYMFQGVPHFAIDTSSSATTVKFPLNHHRARFAEPITGRWVTRDPLHYYRGLQFLPQSSQTKALLTIFIESESSSAETIDIYAPFNLNPLVYKDPSGLLCGSCRCNPADEVNQRYMCVACVNGWRNCWVMDPPNPPSATPIGAPGDKFQIACSGNTVPPTGCIRDYWCAAMGTMWCCTLNPWFWGTLPCSVLSYSENVECVGP